MSSSSSSPRDRRKPAGRKPDASSPSGPTIGSYRILEVIGKGGMGTVYKAVHTGLDRVVALKVLPTQYARNPILLKRFKREATSAAKLHHPNIVAVHDQGESEGTYYLALEYVDGEDLHSLIRKRTRIAPRRCVEIVKQTSQALVHAHSKGIIHRDIKPSNLLVRRDGTVKLADLGLAARGDSTKEAQVTRAGTTVGTVDYMPPEQARGSELSDARSDIYSLGCTLYHMLAGRPPFPNGSIPERLLAHAKKQPDDIQQLNPEVPDELVAVLNRMMAKDPGARYQSAHELLAELEQLTLRRGPAPRQDLASLAEALDDNEPEEEPSVPTRRGPQTASEAAEPSRPRRRPRAARHAAETAPKRRPRRAEAHTDEPPPRARRASSEATPPKPLRRARHASGRKPSGGGLLSVQQWIYVAGGLGVVLLIALIVYVTINMRDATSASTGSLNRNLSLPPAPVDDQDDPATTDPAKQSDDVFPEMGILNKSGEPDAGDDEGSPAQPVLADALPRDRFLPDWYREPQSEPTRTLQLRRWASPGASQEGIFGDLQAACDAVRPGEVAVIEIADQGPFFLRGIKAKHGKKLIVRAAAGYAPLLILDPTDRPGADPPPPSGRCLLDAGRVALELEGLHLATLIEHTTPPGPVALVRCDGPLSVRRCTFTLAQDARYRAAGASGPMGRGPVVGLGEIIARERGAAGDDDPPEAHTFAASVAAVRLGGSVGEAARSSPPKGADAAQASTETSTTSAPPRVLLEDCFVRSAASAALCVETAAADVLLRNTLVVSGDAPALQVLCSAQTSSENAITLRVVGSTLVSDRNGILLARTNGSGKPPGVNVQMLDSIVSHPRGGRAGELLLADRWSTERDGAAFDGATWHARNSRYRGWSKLAALTRPLRTVAATAEQWERLWGARQPGVTFAADGWPERPKAPLASGTADWFALPGEEQATDDDEQGKPSGESGSFEQPAAGELSNAKPAVGCAIETLPALPSYLYERAFERFAAPAPPQLEAPGPDSVPLRIDLSDPQTDLAAELRRAKWEEGQRIVVRGSGRRLVSPIRVEGKSLRLQFEAARRDEPLTLVPRLGRKGDAMIEVIGGDLEIVGGRFESTRAEPSSPRWILHAAGGNVQWTNCWLKGPFPPTEHFDGVLSWSQGPTAARDPDDDDAGGAFCRLSNCLLVGSGRLIQAWMARRHLLVENTAAASAGHLFDLELGSPHERAGTVAVKQSTLWAHGAYFHLAGTAPTAEAHRLPLRLFTAQCLFAAPLELPGRQRRTTLLQCDPNLLREAQVAWHGIDNGYADLIEGFAPVAGSALGPAEAPRGPLDTRQFDRQWTQLWGPWHERHPLTDMKVAWQSEKFQPSALGPGDFMLSGDSEAATWGPTGGPIGADVARLPKAPPDDQRRRDDKKPVLNF